MKRFIDRLQEAWRQNDSLVCVGLDPEPQRFPILFDGARELAARRPHCAQQFVRFCEVRIRAQRPFELLAGFLQMLLPCERHRVVVTHRRIAGVELDGCLEMVARFVKSIR